MIKNKIFIVSVLSVLFLFQAKGQNNDENKIARSYNLKAAVGNIIVDGNLNEESWSNVESTSDFKMSFPVDDRLAEQANQTHVKLTYDNQFL